MVEANRNQKSKFGNIVFELYITIPSRDNRRYLEPKERSGLTR